MFSGPRSNPNPGLREGLAKTLYYRMIQFHGVRARAGLLLRLPKFSSAIAQWAPAPQLRGRRRRRATAALRRRRR